MCTLCGASARTVHSAERALLSSLVLPIKALVAMLGVISVLWNGISRIMTVGIRFVVTGAAIVSPLQHQYK